MSGPLAVLWCLHLVLIPFYVFPSGQPQPSDAILCVVIILSLLTHTPTDRPAHPGTWVLLILISYVVVVSSVWILLLQDHSLFLFPLFYVFNGSAFLTCVSLHSRYGSSFVRTTFFGMLSSTLIQVFFVPFVSSTEFGARQHLFFNNPNQLGYYALLAASLLLLLTADQRRRVIGTVLGVVGAILLAAISLSKAAIVAIVVALVLAVVHNKTVAALLLVMAAWTYAFVDSGEFFALVQSRIATPQHDDGLATRGYDRIINHPQYLFLGAGEGGWERFNSAVEGELHSSLGTLVFSYGIVGFTLFALFLVRASGSRKRMFLAYIAPLSLYGLTHNGLRFTLMWEFLGVLTCIAQLPRREIRSIRP